MSYTLLSLLTNRFPNLKAKLKKASTKWSVILFRYCKEHQIIQVVCFDIL